MKLRRLLSFVLFGSLGAVSAVGQTYTAGRVQFSDPGSFTQKQLEDASGMHPGGSFTANDLGAAAQKLVDTGYFADVGATLDGKITSITIKFVTKPVPTAEMLPVGFENFIWLTHAEVNAAVKGRLPLFDGYLTEGSAHADEVKDALTAALAAKSIAADVTYETVEPTLQHPVRAMAFRVSKPGTRIANVKLAGVTPELVPLVQKSVNSTAHTRYTEGPAEITTADRILAPLLDAGYIEAALIDVVASAATAPDGSAGVVVAASLSVGSIYHVSAIHYAGMPLLSADTFGAALKLHPGDVASRAVLLASLKPIDDAYREKGYMDVVIKAIPKLDAGTHQVDYAVEVSPGEPYRIHEVTAENLDDATRADFARAFQMKEGEVYNPEYAAHFLKNNTALRSLEGYSAAFKTFAYPATHTVDLVISFYRLR